MGLLGILILLIIAGICGALGQTIAGYSHGGCLASIVLGFIGALFGVWIADALSLPKLFVIDVRGQTSFPIIWSIIGAAIFVAFIGLLTRSRNNTH